MRRSTLTALAAAAVLAAGCASGGLRPSYEPFPNARVDTINALPADVIQEAAAGLQTVNMRPNWNSPAEGYLESQWFNVISQQSGVTDRANPDRVILLRFFADPVENGKTQLTSEAVYLRTSDPSVMPRDREMIVPPGHAGDRLLSQIIDGIKGRFGR
jgi:hypothetical protein